MAWESENVAKYEVNKFSSEKNLTNFTNSMFLLQSKTSWKTVTLALGIYSNFCMFSSPICSMTFPNGSNTILQNWNKILEYDGIEIEVAVGTEPWSPVKKSKQNKASK